MNFKDTIWISYSAISAFSKCPRLYYMEYIYRNPQTGNRIQIVNPYLSLGSAVHETIEYLADLPIKERQKISLKDRFKDIFASYQGKKGGFISKFKEDEFKQRGLEMIDRAERSVILGNPTFKMKTNFPSVDLFSDENIKLVGSLDWIEALDSGGAHIIDFKTGNSKESNGSLQLPIYVVLAEENIKKKIEKASYWYLQHDDLPMEHEIGDIPSSIEKIKEISLNIKKAIKSNYFPCSYPGRCFACADYDRIFRGESEMVGTDKGRKKDNFCVFKEKDIIERVTDDNFLDEREKKIFEMRVEKPLSEIGLELNLSPEKSVKIAEKIKEKLKKNLSTPELKMIIKMINQE